ncbi:hypothetical protein [Rhizobium indigoferae]|uniref:Uncharacterized protein n=1 Tax=Rhizobium indigoferae TaxID=158891 RepID=A0ABZ0ZDT4_9HYPH|nr:hypothetical protein [Rhizobium indigoferae]NNU56119.1 hypothetical protein [Rhizobium indigoferae]WQN37760.1 hypothetical protein U5G49_002899 [Rhizobium indigoferae]GLR59359.1 hypothetical protein GCM10007919_40860 [Rhizobium indigoferae]
MMPPKFNEGSARAALYHFLEQRLASRSLPFTDHGFINQRTVATQIGLSQSYVSRSRDIVRYFEEKANNGYLEDRLAALGAFIERGFRNRTLHYSQGRLDRQQAFEAISVGRKAKIAPSIENSLVEYDRRAFDLGYDPSPDLPPVYIPPGSQRERIYLTIQECIANDEPIWKHSCVLKVAIAKKMGIDQANLTLHPEIFEYFNAKYGNRDVNEDVLDRQVEAAIRASIDQRLVDVVSGKLEHRSLIRDAIPEAFSTAERRGRMQALFERFDREAIDAGYICVRKEKSLRELAELLSTGRFTHELYGTANLVKLREALGIPRLFKEAEDLIEAFEKGNATRLASDSYVAAIDGRFFSFAELDLLGYSAEYVERMAKAFRQSYSELDGSNAGRMHLVLLELMRWAKGQGGIIATIVDRLNVRGSVTDVDWVYVLIQFRDSLEEQSRPRVVRTINNLNRKLSVHGLFPWLPAGIAEGRSRKPLGTIKSFAEVAPRSADDHEKTVDGFIEFIEKLTNANNLSLFAECDRLDSRNFFNALRQDFLINGKEGPLEVIAATRTLIEKRQTLLNTRFKHLIEEGVGRLIEGDDLASEGADPSLYWDAISEKSLSQSQRSRIFREYFPHPDTNDRCALKNCLRLIRDRFRRKAPLADEDGYWFFKNRYQEIATSSEIQSYLLPSNDLMHACASVYFQASGVNLPVGRGLLEKCYQQSQDKNYRRVVGFKTRAKGKPIIYYFEMRSDECSALEVALKWGKYLRDIAPPAYKDLMFLQRVGPRIQPINQYGLRTFFKKQRQTIAELRDIPLTPQMWRPSLLLMCAIDNGGKLGTALALAQHTENVSLSYYDRLPLRLMAEIQSRHFKELLEACTIHAIPGGAAFISLDTNLIEARLAEAIDVGIGITCADPYARSSETQLMCETLDCFRCKQMRIMIEAESLSWLIIWRSSLEQAEGDWTRDHPERWEEEFVPFLALVEVVEELMSPAMFLPVWREAEEIADQRLNDPDFRPYQPWN